MTTIVITPLPATPPPDGFAHPEVKRAVMLLMANIKSLKAQLESAQRAIIELQRRK
jgi:hypothetical protein